MISSKKVVIEPTARVNKAKIYPKIAENCKYSYLQCNNLNIILYFNVFLCFFCFSYLGTRILSKKMVIEQTAGVNEAKNCPKTVENCKYYYLPMQLLKYYSVFQHIFKFLREIISGYHNIKQKSGHRTNSWSEWGKNLPKTCQKVRIFLFTMK